MIKPVELEEFEKVFAKNWRQVTYQGGPQDRRTGRCAESAMTALGPRLASLGCAQRPLVAAQAPPSRQSRLFLLRTDTSGGEAAE
ncbi:MAG: hypothetical protein K2P20_02530 [Oscillospiraceae bacterium]|nr:hypothetical protein [Oscillospiraceae bacterium]